ncbi:hypothetical protein HY086_03970 [Candidatus Gottesmanbacteria bacterium]|nr:hypothetical protein [Candidatus Gottesmanbacteria bacterium]
MQQKHVVFFGVLTLVIGLVLRGIPVRRAPTDIHQARSYWKARIDQTGAPAAYKEFKTVYQDLAYKKKHAMVHVFGESLFQTIGLRGLTSCDDTFGYGCFHGFLGSALGAKGLAAAPAIVSACKEKYGEEAVECFHGLGHGLLTYLGIGKLEPTLSVCGSIGSQTGQKSCATGVFMEYNFPTMESLNGKPTVRKAQVNPHEPCSSLPLVYQDSCYLYQANWWLVVYGYDYQKVGELCGQAKDSNAQQVCFEGMGFTTAAVNNYQVDTIRSDCGKLSSQSWDMLCRVGAGMGILREKKERQQALALCLGLGQREQLECVVKLEREEQ